MASSQLLFLKNISSVGGSWFDQEKSLRSRLRPVQILDMLMEPETCQVRSIVMIPPGSHGLGSQAHRSSCAQEQGPGELSGLGNVSWVAWGGRGQNESQKGQEKAFKEHYPESATGFLIAPPPSTEIYSFLHGKPTELSVFQCEVSKARCHHPSFGLYSYASYTPGMIYFWFISCDSVTQDTKL